MMLPGSSASGSFSRADDAWNSHVEVVWFAAVEDRSFDDQGAAIDGDGDHAERDVARVEQVMGQRRRGVVRGRRAVHEGDRAQCWFTHWTSSNREPGRRADRDSPDRAKLHEQIVRVLPVDERLAVERLT
jgi:hypothetical protein